MRTKTVLFQTSPSILVIPVALGTTNQTAVGIYELFSKSFAYCPVETLYWLSYFLKPRTFDEALNDHDRNSTASLRVELDALIEAHFICDIDSDFGKKCAHYRQNWKWDFTTAIFHFTVLNNEYSTIEESAKAQLAHLEVETQPSYFWSPNLQEALQLPVPCISNGCDTLSLLAKRRTNRVGSGHFVELHDLSSCLFSSFGIIGQVKSTTGYMPLTMTPSGGARNPYEAYIIVKRCEGLKPGVYRYCAMEHVLEHVQPIDTEISIALHFAGQDWIDDMAVVVVMVAVFERTMWKYQDPNAYRVVLIEAGHKAQNFMIMATRLGMTACPTAALAHDPLADLLQLKDKMMQVPIYAFSLDKSTTNQDSIVPSHTYKKVLSEIASGLPESRRQ
jgi:SagB-type dehydrogenase family enzyme